MEKKAAGLVVSTNVSGRKGHGIIWLSLGFVSKTNANLGGVLFLPVNTHTHPHTHTHTHTHTRTRTRTLRIPIKEWIVPPKLWLVNSMVFWVVEGPGTLWFQPKPNPKNPRQDGLPGSRRSPSPGERPHSPLPI